MSERPGTSRSFAAAADKPGRLAEVDALLTAALRRCPVCWPQLADAEFEALIVTRISDHGIAALLHESNDALADWPQPVLQFLRHQALGQAMWETRHKAVLGSLLAAMNDADVLPVLLKGTALAYLVYDNPFCRKRGDTDMLVSAAHLERARLILAESGFLLQAHIHSLNSDMRLQEVWTFDAGDGSRQDIDLHWQVANSPVLEGILRFSDIAERLQPVPAFASHAWAPDRVSLMIHACVHRANHEVSPYLVDGRELFEGDRLIWLKDFDLLARTFADGDWEELVVRSAEMEIGRVCHEGLVAACDRLGTDIPAPVLLALKRGQGATRATDYLLGANAVRRAWLDLFAIRGVRSRFAYLRSKVFPHAAFMRARFPRNRHWPVALLYLRRIIGLLNRR